MSRKLVPAMAFVFGISVAGLTAAPVFAQGFSSVQSFMLTGAGCPAMIAVQVVLDGNSALQIQFPSGATMGGMAMGAMTASGPSAFQVSGPTNQSSCAVMVQLRLAARAQQLVTLTSAVASVASTGAQVAATGTQGGQLSLTSAFRIQAAASNPQTSRVAASAAMQTQDVTLNNINLASDASGLVSVLANLQLNAQNAGADAKLRLDKVSLKFRIREDDGDE
jgi:hypothetical protein